MTTWPPERRAELERRWHAGEKPRAIRAAMNLTCGQLAGRVTTYNLHHRRKPMSLHVGHAALSEGRSVFPHSVGFSGNVLRPGKYQVKLGDRVTKGAWAGMPIFTLTLEERATCPRDCAMWAACYGNHMHWAKRAPHGTELEGRLWSELSELQERHPRGFVIRLHVLGDFYSVPYVNHWREALEAFPALRVFGYTAWQRGTRTGDAIAALRDSSWSRFAVRTSGADDGPRTSVIECATDAPEGVIVCPAQTGKTRSCATCSLCWATTKPVAFVRH